MRASWKSTSRKRIRNLVAGWQLVFRPRPVRSSTRSRCLGFEIFRRRYLSSLIHQGKRSCERQLLPIRPSAHSVVHFGQQLAVWTCYCHCPRTLARRWIFSFDPAVRQLDQQVQLSCNLNYIASLRVCISWT